MASLSCDGGDSVLQKSVKEGLLRWSHGVGCAILLLLLLALILFNQSRPVPNDRNAPLNNIGHFLLSALCCWRFQM